MLSSIYSLVMTLIKIDASYHTGKRLLKLVKIGGMFGSNLIEYGNIALETPPYYIEEFVRNLQIIEI